ncbi:unnamed protein product [Ixodes hexagonus]
MTLSSGSMVSRNPSSCDRFSVSSQMMIVWLTVCTAARSKEPTNTWKGLLMYCWERRRTPSGQVVLVITVCRSGRMSNSTFLIWGSKPMSSMRSASSRMRNVTYLRSMMLFMTRSLRRPGVAMTISTPRFTVLICSLRLPPP